MTQKPEEKAAGNRAEGDDFVLSTLVRIANGIKNTHFVGITLNIEGRVVTGYLISASSYYRQFAAIWSPNPTGDDAQAMFSRMWLDVADEIDAEDNEGESPEFIHLEQARYVLGTTLVPSNGALLWRGRIEKVSGYSIGILRTGAEPA